MRQTVRLVIELDMDAEAASSLPAFPGAYGEPPIDGLTHVFTYIGDECAKLVQGSIRVLFQQNSLDLIVGRVRVEIDEPAELDPTF